MVPKDYEDKMAVSLLKLELLSANSAVDTDQFYAGKRGSYSCSQVTYKS